MEDAYELEKPDGETFSETAGFIIASQDQVISTLKLYLAKRINYFFPQFSWFI
jgi:hypothetical protein